MNRFTIVAAFCLLAFTLPLRAEKPIMTGSAPGMAVSPGELKATPEMWFYEQAMRQYRDPQMAVRINADYRAQQRQRRLESMKWFGLSNSRPRASSDPYHNDYSPGWVSNPGSYPARWNGISPP
jgi:hypothetical protein